MALRPLLHWLGVGSAAGAESFKPLTEDIRTQRVLVHHERIHRKRDRISPDWRRAQTRRAGEERRELGLEGGDIQTAEDAIWGHYSDARDAPALADGVVASAVPESGIGIQSRRSCSRGERKIINSCCDSRGFLQRPPIVRLNGSRSDAIGSSPTRAGACFAAWL